MSIFILFIIIIYLEAKLESLQALSISRFLDVIMNDREGSSLT